MDIHARFNTDELVNLCDSINNARVTVSFWGERRIVIDGDEGSISLNTLALKILNISYKRCEEDNLSMRERVAGIDITNKLNQFYGDSDTQLSEANWFTRLLSWVREFSFTPYTTRFYVEDDLFMSSPMSQHFGGFSEEGFVREFGARDNNDVEMGSFGPPLRIIASEQAMRGRVN